MAERSWIARLVDLDRSGDAFVAHQPVDANATGRLFGGLIAAQGLAAGSATVEPDKQPQSLHAYFVRSGRPGVDVELEVERIRDGRNFDTRRVTARQDGSAILEMLVSFHTPEAGTDWSPPPPAMLPIADTRSVGGSMMGGHFEIRMRAGADMFAGPPHWIRATEPIEDDPVVRACLLTYMSDMGLMAAARPPGQPLVFGAGMRAASLDHTVWFHRPFDPTQWHYYDAKPLNHNDARGLALGSFLTEDGTLVASMAQEALWRL